MKFTQAIPVLAIFLLFSLHPPALLSVHAQSSAVSQVYLSPTATCCYLNGSTFVVNVMLNLTASDAINVIDVRLDYTGFWSVSTNRTGIVQAQSIDYRGNIFGSSGDLLFECIDAVAFNGQRCSSDDAVAGQIHFSQGGNLIHGPLSAVLLFTATFGVHGNGTSIFSFDRADLVNPSPDPSNPLLLNPHSIPLLRFAGIFANRGLAAFFNYEPSESEVILPGKSVTFDAGMSFNATASTRLINPGFRWNFGDGYSLLDQSSSIAQHLFTKPGSYRVELNITESNGAFGSIARTVSVVPVLGAISLKVNDARGTPIIGGIFVQIFNSSSILPFLNKTIDRSGRVNFTSLSPGNYLVKFSGAGYQDSSKTETVNPGLTTPDNIYLLFIPPPAANFLGGIILISVIVAGLGLGTVAYIVRKRKTRTESRARTSRLKK